MAALARLARRLRHHWVRTLLVVCVAASLPVMRLALGATSNFQNGSFGTNQYGGNQYENFSGTNSTAITGWTIPSGRSISVVGTGIWQTSPGNSSAYSIDLDGNSPGTITQTFATTAGQAYTLKFDMSGDFYGSAVESMLVTVAGASQTYSVNPAGKSASNMGYVTQALSFTATSGSTTLTFASQDASSSTNGVVLDNVHILTTVSGTVFEDTNYGGGAGRNKTAALATGGSARSGATVELYSASGAFLSTTTTSAAGAFSFAVDVNSTYSVRVVDSTVSSAHAGANAGLVGVQTYRTDASSGTAAAVTDHVGGENPALADAGVNAGSATLASLTSSTRAPQSITTVAVGTAGVSGLDFGFNFDTIVNTSASGQGSLTQWIANANAFTDQGSMAQSGSRTLAGVTTALAVGTETSIFMITNGSAVAGLRAGLSSQLTSGAFARIAPSSGVLYLQSANVNLDGATQTANVGNTNSGTTGNGGTVGVGATSLAKFDLPEVEIDLTNGNCICAQSNYDSIQAIALSAGSVYLGGNYNLASDILVAMDALGSSNATSTESNNYGISTGTVNNATINHNYVRVNNSGVRRDVPGANLTIQYNEITSPYNGQSNTFDGIIVYPGSGDLIQYNLLHNIVGAGFEVPWGGGTNLLFQQNTLNANGLNYGTSTASGEPGNVVIYGSLSSPMPQLTISQNIITGSGGDAITVMTGAGFKITQNSIYGNAVGYSNGLGIDLDPSGNLNGNSYSPNGVWTNTGSPNAGWPNNGMNYPVFTSAGVTGSTLGVIGYVGTASSHSAFANATVEIFKSSKNASGYGDGQNYIGTLTADANGNFTGTLTVPSGVSFVLGEALTATATDASGDSSEFGPNYTVNSPYSMTPASFNAFETSTVAGSIAGVIQTKIAGSSFGLDIVAVNSAGTGVDTTFTGTVSLQLLDASNNSGALVNGCRSTWVALGGSSAVTFVSSNNGRLTTNFTVANAYRDVRVQMSYTPSVGAPVVSCSTDDFAIRPSVLALLAATDTSWTTAGTGRILSNVLATGGNVHKAGQAFTLSAQAQNAAGVLTNNYSGTTSAILNCVLPAGCTAGNLGSLTFTPTLSAGVMSTNDAVYSDVGAFTLQLVDTTFAAVDAADSTTAQRYIYSAAVNVGRFVPDHFALSVSTNGSQYTYGSGSCTSRSFTYLGQPVSYKTVPIVAVTAQNASNATTFNYKNELWKLTAASMSQSYTDAGGNALSASIGAASVNSSGNGTGTMSPNAGDTVTWVRSAAGPTAPFTAQAIDTVGVADTSETSGSITQAVALAVEPSFDDGASMVYGRIAMTNAYGVETQTLAVPAETQYYNGSVWITNAVDFCTAIPVAALSFANWQKNLNACETSVSGGGTVSRGRTSLLLSAPGATNNGSVDLSLNLGSSASGSACLSGAVQASTTTGLSYLEGPWGGGTYSANPTARASFGEYGVVAGFRREN